VHPCLAAFVPRYIDQSVQDLGATKIVVWSAGTRATHSLAQLYTPSLVAMNLTYWALMEDRLVYALTRYPRIQLQLIVYVSVLAVGASLVLPWSVFVAVGARLVFVSSCDQLIVLSCFSE
jgi:hypothetical protein